MKLHSSALRACALSAALFTAAPLISVQAASAQSSSLTAEYVQTLERIENAKIRIAQTELFVSQQGERISELRALIASAPATNAEIEAMLPKAVTQVERMINSDAPFLIEERRNRLLKLKEVIASSEYAPVDKYARLLSLLKIEMEYGQSIDYYEGERPLNDGEQPIMVPETKQVKDDDGVETTVQVVDEITGEPSMIPEQGYYIYYGRLALDYLNVEATSARRWNGDTKTWDELSAGDLVNVRRAVRMARGETAQAVIAVELKAPG